jgi:cytoskeletal protein RodZ
VNEDTDQIGELLRKAREATGLSIEDVTFQTKLPTSAIEALEADDFSHFISPVYAKSFLLQYSGFLHVDAASWLEALQPSSFIGDSRLLPILDSGPVHTVAVPVAVNESIASWKSILVMLAATMVIIYAFMLIFDYFETKFGNDVPTNQQTHEVIGQSSIVEKTATIQFPKAIVTESPSTSTEKLGSPDARHEHVPRAIIVR